MKTILDMLVRATVAISFVGMNLLAASNLPQSSRDCLANCTIELQHVVRLTDAGHPNTLPELAISVVAPSSGRYVTRSKDGRRLVVFDAGGGIVRFVEGPVDRPFRLISTCLTGPRGTLQVYDFFSKSLTTIGADFEIVRVVAFPYPPTIALTDNRYIHVQQIATPELVGQPFHVLGPDGTILRSFGSETGSYRADMPLVYDRVATIGSDGMVWGASLGKYVIEKWNPTTGMRVSQIQVQSTWFKESARFERPGERPVPIVDGLWEQGDHLWVLLRDADSHWRQPDFVRGEHAVDWREFESTYDSVLEVIAIRTGQVVASRRFDRPLQGRSGTFLLSSIERLANGVSQIDVSQPQLTKKETAR